MIKRKSFLLLLFLVLMPAMVLCSACDLFHTHNYSSEWSYNESGHYHKCTGCEEISNYGEHTFESVVTLPTYEEQGYTNYTCTVCGYSYNTDYTNALEHNYDLTTWAHNEMGHYHSCTDEGYENLYTDFEPHTWDGGVQNGNSITYTCETCTEAKTSTMFKTTFACDENSSILIYNTQDVSGSGTAGTIAYARDGNSGMIVDSGDGQVNFKVVLTEGYTIDEITITPNNYKNLKLISKNCYRITKITGDITVSITTKEKEYDFNIQRISGDEDCYTIQENDYDEYTVTFTEITSKTVYQISGLLNGNIVIDVGDDYKFELNMSDVTITSAYASPIVVLSGDRITLNQNEGTTNTIIDNRAEVTDSAQNSACVYAKSDLTLAGTGVLNVTSVNNNGIQTKDNLVAKELTLTVNCKDNALKGNDSVTISSGTYTLIAKRGDGIKTTNSDIKYEEDGVTIKKVHGTVAITGGVVTIYSACDGIDAAYNAEISGEITVVNIYTSIYSIYSETMPNSMNNSFYVKATSTDYNYSIYYYNAVTNEYIWKNQKGYKKVTSMSSGNPGRPGGTPVSYYYYEFDWLTNYSNFKVYAYSSGQAQGSNSTYYKCSDSFSTLTTKNAVAFSGLNFNNTLTTYSENSNDYSRKGIKVDNQVVISNGIITIKSYDDAIHANNDTVLGDEDDISDDYYGDGIVNISGGTITITTKDDGIHADQDVNISGGIINVITAYEGIEANRIYVMAGEINVFATNDAMNVADLNGFYVPLINISGGYIELDVMGGDTDTIDSNGDITISGGIIIVKNRQLNAVNMVNGTIDLDGTLTITGGNIISIGCWCGETVITPNVSNTSVTLASGDYTIKDAEGTELCSFTLGTSYRGYRIKLCDITEDYYFYCDSTLIGTISC